MLYVSVYISMDILQYLSLCSVLYSMLIVYLRILYVNYYCIKKYMTKGNLLGEKYSYYFYTDR